MERHNSCLNTRAIIDFIDRRGGDVEELLVGLEDDLRGIPAPLSFLRDTHNWVSTDVCGKMYANARRITGDPKIAYHIGFESVVHKRLGYIQEILLQVLGTPSRTITRIKSINDKFNRNKRIELAFLNRHGAVVRLYWDSSLPLYPDFCLMNQGVYSAIPSVWGLPAAQVRETKCQYKGAPYCEYDVSWQNPSFLRRLRLLLNNQRRLLAETLSEMERDKILLEAKYGEVQALNRSLQQKIDQLMSIHQASAAVLSELDFTKLMPEVLRIFIKEIGYSRGMIMLIDEQTQVLRFVEGVGENPEELYTLLGYEIPLSRKHNILAQVIQSGQPVLVSDSASLNLNPDNIIIKNFHPQQFVLLPLMARGKVTGVLAADRGAVQDPQTPLNLDREYLQGFANQVALAIENARMYKGMRESFLSTIQTLVQALEAKDPYTRGHSERVTSYSVRLAEKINLSAQDVEQVRNICLIHDIGKIGIDRALLNKKEPLLGSEFSLIRQHPAIGERIIQPLNLSKVEVAVVRNHHERYDGAGYPDGLAGEEIPIQVRIASICDTFDAMTSDRSYRHALPIFEALRRLDAAAGTQLDPNLVPVFIEMVKKGEVKDILGGKLTIKAAS